MTHYFVLRCFLFLLLGYLGMPFYKLQRAKEGAWKAEDLNQTLNQVQLNEPPPTNYMIPEPMFPDLDSSQVGSYSGTQVSWKASHLICALVVQYPLLMAEFAFLCLWYISCSPYTSAILQSFNLSGARYD